MTIRFFHILALFAALALPLGNEALADDVVLATSNPSAAATMTARDAKRLLTGQSPKWPDGTPVVVVLPPEGSPELAWLCDAILKMPEDVYRRALLQKVFHGAVPKPISTKSEDAASAIQLNGGAIGPVSVGEAGDLLVIQIGD